jgi:hypothetical protein
LSLRCSALRVDDHLPQYFCPLYPPRRIKE